jgi:uncharacterized NAD(P)/FAD-binding protein YdhS
VECHESGVRLEIKGGTLNADLAFDCTGSLIDIRRQVPAFLQSLLTDGHARPDHLGVGIDVDPNGLVVSRDGIKQENLFAIGALRRGQLLESTAVRELRQQAVDLAGCLIRYCR